MGDRYRVTIQPSSGGFLSAWINGADEEFPNETRAYLDALASTAAFTRWGARSWARRHVKQLARDKRNGRSHKGQTETFEIEVAG